MLGLLTRQRAFHEVFAGVSNSYQPVGFVRLAGEHIYVLSDPDLIWQVFVTDAKCTAKGRGLQLTRPLLGNGLLTSEGADHMRNRRLVQPAFHRQRIAGYAQDIVAAVDDRQHMWLELGATSPVQVDVVDEMSAITLDVVGRALFGADLTGSTAAVRAALTEVLAGFTIALRPSSALLMALPLPKRQRIFAAVEQLDVVIAELIAEKRAQVAAGRAGADILSLLLQTVDEQTGESLTDQQIRDETMTMVLAGHETTAMALSWALRDLTMNPEVTTWLREELDANPADGMADLEALPRTYAVIAETMRLRPPAWILGRYVTAPITLGEYTVPPGSTVMASQLAMHRDPRFWPDPESYRPARWLDESGSFDERNPGVPRGVWFPFGFGARRCIGEQFAWVEAVLALARLVRSWDIQVLDPASVEAMPAVTLRPRGAMRARVTPRVV